MKRYDLWCNQGFAPTAEQVKDGDWVRYKDVEKLLTENKRLKNKLQVLKECHIVILDAYQVSTQRQFARKSEIERLKAEVESLRELVGANKQLKLENELLLKDIDDLITDRDYFSKLEVAAEKEIADLKAENERLKQLGEHKYESIWQEGYEVGRVDGRVEGSEAAELAMSSENERLRKELDDIEYVLNVQNETGCGGCRDWNVELEDFRRDPVRWEREMRASWDFSSDKEGTE